MIDRVNSGSDEVLISEFFGLFEAATRTFGEHDVMSMLSVHRTTLLRWRTGQTRIPNAVRALVAILASGRPPQMDEREWRGFRFERDAIVSPTDRRFTAAALSNMEWQDQLTEALHRRIGRLEEQLRQVQALRQDSGANDPVGRPGITDVGRVGNSLAARRRRLHNN